MRAFQNVRVSARWKVVLDAAWAAGVRFQLNSGQRTMAEQAALYRLYRSGRGNLAAFPSPFAPHIRVGLQAHAIDVDSFAYSDGENRLERWLDAQGVSARNTVPGESWHLEVSERDLKRLAARFAATFYGFPEDEKRWVYEYDTLKKAGRNRARREVLRRVMGERRQEIWREAEKTGWRKNNRSRRYASLRARS